MANVQATQLAGSTQPAQPFAVLYEALIASESVSNHGNSASPYSSPVVVDSRTPPNVTHPTMGVTLPHTRGATPTGRIRWATVAPAARLHSIDNPERQGPAKRARLAATPFQVAMTNLVDPNVVSDLPRVNQYHSSASSSQNRKHCCRCNTCGGGPCTITTFPAAPVDAPPRYSRLVGHLQPRRYPPIPAVVDGRKTTPVSAVLDTVDSDDTLGGPDPTVVVPYEVSNPTKCIIYRPVIYRYTVPSFSPTINTDRMWARNGIVGPPQVAKGNRVYLRRNVALTE